MDPFDYLERLGCKAVRRKDGRYDVRGNGILEPFEVFNLWLSLKCWPRTVEALMIAPPPPPKQPFVASGEFWLGVATVFVCLALLMGWVSWWL